MKLHANAALSLNKRRLLVHRVVEQDWSLTKAAEAAEVSEPTARKWVARYLAEGEAGLLDRPSAANRIHNRTPEDRIGVICALRRLRMTGAEIAEMLGMAETTVSGILTRSGLGRLGRLGLEPARGYERSRPASCFTSTSRSWDGSSAPPATGSSAASASSATQPAPTRAGSGEATSATSASTSASTTPPGSPTSRCFKTRRRRPRSAFCAGPWPSTAATGWRPSG